PPAFGHLPRKGNARELGGDEPLLNLERGRVEGDGDGGDPGIANPIADRRGLHLPWIAPWFGGRTEESRRLRQLGCRPSQPFPPRKTLVRLEVLPDHGDGALEGDELGVIDRAV